MFDDNFLAFLIIYNWLNTFYAKLNMFMCLYYMVKPNIVFIFSIIENIKMTEKKNDFVVIINLWTLG